MRRQQVLTEATLPDFLRKIGVFDPFEAVRVEKAGDGNINWVRRALSPEGKSFVIKQARPALERFPEYQAPTKRLVFEARYYGLARPFDEEGVCPGIHGFEEADRVLVLEDLGGAPRLDRWLAEGRPAGPALVRLARFLGRVHAGTRDPALADRFANGDMQRLHGDHIFRLPLEPNAFPLPPETAAAARRLWADEPLRALAARAYERYLRPEGALVHGDVQAGNILLAGRSGAEPPDAMGPKLLDAEIAHFGDPAFDVGTLLAHVALPAVAAGRPDAARPDLDATWWAYAEAHGPDGRPERVDAVRYAGLEMLRRTIGAARVALVEDDAAGLRVIESARRWILDPTGPVS